jgi:hypothetical protein
MTNIGQEMNSADARRRQIRVIQVIFGGAAAVAALTLFSAAPSTNPGNPVASGTVRLVDQSTSAPATVPSGPQATLSGSGSASFIAVDDGVNDQGQSSGDIFTQNAQDQSTA